MPRGRLLEIAVLRRASARPEDSELNSGKLAATFPGSAASGEHSLLSLLGPSHELCKSYFSLNPVLEEENELSIDSRPVLDGPGPFLLQLLSCHVQTF